MHIYFEVISLCLVFHCTEKKVQPYEFRGKVLTKRKIVVACENDADETKLQNQAHCANFVELIKKQEAPRVCV